MARCQRCPTSADVACLYEIDPLRYAWACEWAASGEEIKRRHVAEKSAALAAPAEAVASPAIAAPRRWDEAMLLVLDCDYRIAPGCGCTADPDRCLLHKGSGADPAAVVAADCLRCVRDGAAAAAT